MPCNGLLPVWPGIRNLSPVALFIRSIVDRCPTILRYGPEASSLQHSAFSIRHLHVLVSGHGLPMLLMGRLLAEHSVYAVGACGTPML